MGTSEFNAAEVPCDGLASHLGGGGGDRDIPGNFMLQKLVGHLAHMHSLPFSLTFLVF